MQIQGAGGELVRVWLRGEDVIEGMIIAKISAAVAPSSEELVAVIVQAEPTYNGFIRSQTARSTDAPVTAELHGLLIYKLPLLSQPDINRDCCVFAKTDDLNRPE